MECPKLFMSYCYLTFANIKCVNLNKIPKSLAVQYTFLQQIILHVYFNKNVNNVNYFYGCN